MIRPTRLLPLAPFVLVPFDGARGACETCFGAAVDSPTVAAVTASMFLLLVVTSCVLGGLTVFFRQAHERASDGLPTQADDGPPGGGEGR